MRTLGSLCLRTVDSIRRRVARARRVAPEVIRPAAVPIGAAAVLSIVVALSACSGGQGTTNGGAPQGPPPVTVAKPMQRSIVDWDDYVGRFEAVDTVEIRPRVSGYIQSVEFRDGQIVRKGQLLFVIDPRPFEAALAQARADAARARAELKLARSEVKRSEALLADGAVSREEFERQSAAAATAEAAVAAAEAGIASRALDVEFARIRAPIAGRISDARVKRGNLVSGGSAGQATLLTTIVSLDPIHFAFEGSEAVYLKYQRANREGTRRSSRDAPNPVEIRLADEPSYSIRGRMDFTDNALDPGSGTIRGRAIVRNPDYFLTPGMFGRMRLLGSGKYTALLIPDEAVVTDQTRKVVMTVAANGDVVPKVVELGPLLDGLRIVRTGLTRDDRVIISGLQRVRPGQKASPQPGKIVPPAPGQSPEPDAAYAPPPAASASAADAR